MTFNVQELSRRKLDVVDAQGRGAHPQLCKAAEIIQRLRPHVLLLNEIDWDAKNANTRLFLKRYLAVGQNGQLPIDYPHPFFGQSNTGFPSGKDFDNDGRTDGPADAYGFGRYPGEYSMALFSQYPLDEANIRTFQKFLWKDMPRNLMPDGKDGKPAWYNAEEVAVFRLSSKSHWDVPVKIGGQVIHCLCSHPTPPIFDGAEDHNGRRNFDEIRLWGDYLTGGDQADYLYDDAGRRGGLAADAAFVILGDLNADPLKGDHPYGKPAAQWVLEHPRVTDPLPTSPGAPENKPTGAPHFYERKTSYFGRIDYALPSRGLKVLNSGVFWPAPHDPLARLFVQPDRASDHRPVWVDLSRGP